MILRLGLPLLLSVVWINCLFGQREVQFNHLSLKDGLSQATVYSILQDKQGVMWFGTRDGLNRYNGYNFEVFKYKPNEKTGISDSDVRVIYEDKVGDLWIGTDNGLNRFLPETQQFEHFEYDSRNHKSLSNNSISAIAEDKAGNLWVGTENGGMNRIIFEQAAGNFRKVKEIERFLPDPEDINSLSSEIVRDMFLDSRGIFWIATERGLDRLIETDKEIIFQHYRHNPFDDRSPATNLINSIAEDKNGDLWLGTWGNGIERMTMNEEGITTFKHFPFKPNQANSINQAYVITVKSDKKGDIWVGTWTNGLNHIIVHPDKSIDIKSFLHNPNDPKSLAHNSIRSIYEDKAGILWVGTYSDGISKIDPNYTKFKHIYRNFYEENNTLSGDDIWAIEKDHFGYLWVGTWGNGLNRIQEINGQQQFEHFHVKNKGLPNDKVTFILKDKTNNLWIGTWGNGICKVVFSAHQEVKGFQTYPNQLKSSKAVGVNNIRTIYEDSKGNLWLGSIEGLHRLVLLSNGDYEYVDYFPYPDTKNGLKGNNIYAIIEDHLGFLWVGTTHGGVCRANLDSLYQKDPETVQFECFRHFKNAPKSISSNEISSLFIDSSRRLWIGTSNGGLNLFDYNTKTFKHYHESKNGLPNNVINGILEDNYNNLWISSNKGLSRFNPLLKTFENFDTKDGLQSNEFINHATFKDEDGTLYFGGINGFNFFKPSNIKDNNYIPPLVFTDFKLNNVSVDFNQKKAVIHKHISYVDRIKLKYANNIITFEFAALNYSQPEKNQYRYQLVGFDDEWQFIGNQRQVTFTNLDPGKYTLKVQGANNDGLWNTQDISLDIIITPPFWGTWWFQLLLVLLLTTIALYYLRYRIASVKNEKEKLERLVAERTREIAKQKQLVEERSNFKEQFFSNVSHELRTPLNGILGMSHLLLKTNLTDHQLQFTEAIKSSADNLLVIINDLLDISKINAGKLELMEVPFDAQKLFTTLFDLFKPQTESKNIDLIFNIDKALPQYLSGDKVRLYQILMNLIGNAFKFTTAGYILMTVKILEKTDDKLNIEFAIKDTGIGIAQEKLEKIFRSFSQIIDNTGYHYEGTGLGLTIVQNLVQLNNGKITVESQLGEGSVFKVQLPFCVPPQDKIDQITQNNAINIFSDKWANKKVFLLEDNPINKLYATNLFIDWKLNVETAETILEAKNTVQQYKYDCIFADVKLPDGDGIEFIKLLRSNPEHLNFNTPVIILTAGATQEDRDKAKNVAIQAYLTKPFDPNELLTILNHVFSTNPFDADTINAENKVDYKYLENLSKLVRYNKKHMVEMIEIGLEQIPKTCAKMAINLDKNDIAGLQFNAHTLKSTLRTLGISELIRTIEHLEKAAKNKEATEQLQQLFSEFCENATAHTEKLTFELQKLKAEIKRLSIV